MRKQSIGAKLKMPLYSFGELSVWLLVFLHFLPITEVFPGIVRSICFGAVFVMSFLGFCVYQNHSIVVTRMCLTANIAVFIIVAYLGMWRIRDLTAGIGSVSRMLFLIQFWLYFFSSSPIEELDLQRKQRLLHALLLVITITAVTTTIGNIVFDQPSRLLAGLASKEQRRIFNGYNIGGYSFGYSLAVLIPYLMYLIENKYKRTLCILLLIISIACIIITEYTICIIATAFGLSLYFILKSKHKILLIICAIICFIFLSDTLLIVDILSSISRFLTYHHYSTLADRVGLIREIVLGNVYKNDSLVRDVLYRRSEEIFINSPIIGCLVHPVQVGGHSEVRDILAGTGLFGFILFVTPLFYTIRRVKLRVMDRKLLYAFYSSASALCFISYYNTLFAGPAMGMMFFVMPFLLIRQQTKS